MCLPEPSRLAALGAVLCLYRPQHGGELGGWSQAMHACACSGLDSEGLREQVLFFDREGRCCWRICLLPDSDFLAWEDMASQLPAASPAPRPGGIGERLWRGLAGRLQGERWQGSVLRLHALAGHAACARQEQGGFLAASPAALSPLGAATARRIARAEGVDADGIAPVDAPRRARGGRGRGASPDRSTAVAMDNVIPLFRFNPGAQA